MALFYPHDVISLWHKLVEDGEKKDSTGIAVESLKDSEAKSGVGDQHCILVWHVRNVTLVTFHDMHTAAKSGRFMTISLDVGQLSE